jgi:hypothetical protein
MSVTVDSQVSGTGMRWSGRPSLARIQCESAVAR